MKIFTQKQAEESADKNAKRMAEERLKEIERDCEKYLNEIFSDIKLYSGVGSYTYHYTHPDTPDSSHCLRGIKTYLIQCGYIVGDINFAKREVSILWHKGNDNDY